MAPLAHKEILNACYICLLEKKISNSENDFSETFRVLCSLRSYIHEYDPALSKEDDSILPEILFIVISIATCILLPHL